MKTGALAGFALCSNMTAICSNTSVHVGFTIFALCGHAGVLIVSSLPGSCQPLESESLIEVASGTSPLTFDTALSELGTKCSMLTDLLRPLLLCGTALCLRRNTRGHIDHFVGVDRGACCCEDQCRRVST